MREGDAKYHTWVSITYMEAEKSDKEWKQGKLEDGRIVALVEILFSRVVNILVRVDFKRGKKILCVNLYLLTFQYVKQERLD